MKVLLLSLLTLAAVSQPGSCNKNKDCVGTPRQDCVCIQIYDPVCGCDGKTYANECVAACAGVKRWTKGACEEK